MAYKQARNRNRRLKKTWEETNNKASGGVYFNEKKNRYVKYSASNTSGLAKSFRKISNKKVRKAELTFNPGCYKKVFDYKWTIM